VRSLTGELQQVFHSLASARADTPPVDVTREPEGSDDDDVIDADFTVS
jgi:hypothetical protein